MLRVAGIAAVAALLCPATARAQLPDLVPGSVAADRARIAEITGRAVERDTSHRSLASVLRNPELARSGVFVVEPHVFVVHNSNIPYSLNDGPLWAGRGWNLSASTGVGISRTMFGITGQVLLAPTLVYSQNRPFEIFPNADTSRSRFASPFHPRGDATADAPLRFGDLYLFRVDPGRSRISVANPWVELGVTADNEVWGPAIRSQIVMSANAAGIPRVYARIPRPLRTAAGIVSAELMAGTLTESDFFDFADTNNFRRISGALVSIRPAFDTTFTFGFERTVVAPVNHTRTTLDHAFDALTHWEVLRFPTDTAPDGTRKQKSDQIAALFARKIFPDAGFEFWAEWARLDPPRTLTELLTAAHHTSGYTIGAQWAQPHDDGTWMRFQTEFSYIEQSKVLADRPQQEFYTGRVTEQGYTQRGQPIGVATGLGSSSQFIGADYLTRAWQVGGYVGRIRWENDALYRQFVANFFRHDATVFVGARGAWRGKRLDYAADLTYGYRYNYLFQQGRANPGGIRTVDKRNLTLSVSVSPR